MLVRSKKRLRWHAALSFAIAFLIAVSTGHGNIPFFAVADQIAASADDAHGHPPHDHQNDEKTAACVACPPSVCCFIVAPAFSAGTGFERPFVLPLAGHRPASALSDGPLRPPNLIAG